MPVCLSGVVSSSMLKEMWFLRRKFSYWTGLGRVCSLHLCYNNFHLAPLECRQELYSCMCLEFQYGDFLWELFRISEYLPKDPSIFCLLKCVQRMCKPISFSFQLISASGIPQCPTNPLPLLVAIQYVLCYPSLDHFHHKM